MGLRVSFAGGLLQSEIICKMLVNLVVQEKTHLIFEAIRHHGLLNSDLKIRHSTIFFKASVTQLKAENFKACRVFTCWSDDVPVGG